MEGIDDFDKHERVLPVLSLRHIKSAILQFNSCNAPWELQNKLKNKY